MSMNDTPRSERVHIAFFGRRNAGKSSVVNAVTNQQVSIVSDIRGTTTDPVSKSMELLPLGPVVVIDTPGFDDEGTLGQMRVQRTKEILDRTDTAVLVAEAGAGLTACDRELLKLFAEREIPCVLAWNKCDLEDAAIPAGESSAAGRDSAKGEPAGQESLQDKEFPDLPEGLSVVRQIRVSALTGENIGALKEAIAEAGKASAAEKVLAGDLFRPMDLVILVIPLDFAAPKGRLILPQVQVLRDVLDHGGRALCVRESELAQTLSDLREKGEKPALVITDSQAFRHVSSIVPEDIYLTSFSILMARYKGVLKKQLEGVKALRELKDGDTVLISEGCSHHRQCGDIGTVKLPAWIREYSGKELFFETSSGLSFPADLQKYALIVHCGSCMLNEKEVAARNRRAAQQGVPITNYGMTIAEVNGILPRALKVLPEAGLKSGTAPGAAGDMRNAAGDRLKG